MQFIQLFMALLPIIFQVLRVRCDIIDSWISFPSYQILALPVFPGPLGRGGVEPNIKPKASIFDDVGGKSQDFTNSSFNFPALLGLLSGSDWCRLALRQDIGFVLTESDRQWLQFAGPDLQNRCVDVAVFTTRNKKANIACVSLLQGTEPPGEYKSIKHLTN